MEVVAAVAVGTHDFSATATAIDCNFKKGKP
jgi:hypothetical protein